MSAGQRKVNMGQADRLPPQQVSPACSKARGRVEVAAEEHRELARVSVIGPRAGEEHSAGSMAAGMTTCSGRLPRLHWQCCREWLMRIEV